MSFFTDVGVGGGGGGTGGLTKPQVQAMINKLFKNALFDEATNTLSFEKEDGTIASVDLSSLADVSWNDLEYAGKYGFINLMHYNKRVAGYSYRANGDVYKADNNWSVFFLDVQAGKQYTVYRKVDDNSRYIFTNSVGGQKVSAITVNSKVNSNGFVGTSFTVPTTAGITKVAIQFNHTQNTIKDIMIFEGVVNSIDRFVPYTNGKSIQIGKEVSLEFDAMGTNLISQTIHDAIIEVNGKIPKKRNNKVFNVDDNIWNSVYFRIPSLLRTKAGNLLAFSDIRYNTARDQSLIDIGAARSINEGESWDYQIALASNKTTNVSRVMDSTSLVTRTGRIILLGGGWEVDTSNWESQNGMPDDDWNPFITISDNDGETWSNKISLKSTEPTACLNQPQGTIAWLGGVGNGIQMSDDTLVFPIQIVYFQNVNNGVGSGKITRCGLIYSKDNGSTWTMCNSFVMGTENMIVEVNGSLIMNARNGNNRASYITSDLGTTWETYEPLHNKISNRAYGCQGSFIAFDTLCGHRVGLISTPKNLNNNYSRDNITIYMIDFDNTSAGIRELLVPYPFAGNASGAGYSSLAYGTTKEGQRKLDIIYEDNGSISHKNIDFLLSEIEDIVVLGGDISWNQLNYVSETKDFDNLYNTTNRFEAQGTFVAGGGVSNTTNSKWRRVVIPVVGGKTYYITSIRGVNNSTAGTILGSSDVVEFKTDNNTFNTTTCVNSAKWGSGGKIFNRNIIKHTTNKGTTHMGFNIHVGYQDATIEFMVWESSQVPPSEYIENSKPGMVLINGSKVDISFNSQGNLTSTTVREALDELNRKINTGSGGTIGINDVVGLREELNKKAETLELTEEKLSLKRSSVELSNIPVITTAEIQLILQNLT